MGEQSQFDLGLQLRSVRGPFSALLTVDDDFIEVRPEAPFPLSRLRWFRPARAERADVTSVRGDRRSRAGMRIETRSGRLDRFVLIPGTAGEREDLHRVIRAHGYTVT